jgi:transposase InsO family protein
MRKDTINYIRSCDLCQHAKASTASSSHLHDLRMWQIPAPFHTIHLDLCGPFNTCDKQGKIHVTQKGNQYILAMLDAFTGWAEAIPLPDKTSEVVCEAFILEWITRYGVPYRILSDNGMEFTSKYFEYIIKKYGIKHNTITPHHAPSNGRVENFIKYINTSLRIFLATQPDTDWDRLLPYAMFAYRTAENDVTKYTPYQLLYGIARRLPIDLLYQTTPEYAHMLHPIKDRLKLLSHLRSAYDKITTLRLQRAILNQKHITSKFPPYTFSINDPVLLIDHNPNGKLPAKLRMPVKGPFTIIRILTNNTAYLREDTSNKETGPYNLCFLRKYVPRLTPLQPSPEDQVPPPASKKVLAPDISEPVLQLLPESFDIHSLREGALCK